MTAEKKAMKDKEIAKKAKETQKKIKKIQNKAKETPKKAKKIQNKTREAEKKGNKAKKTKVIKGVTEKVIKLERDKEIKKKIKEAEIKAQEAEIKAQEAEIKAQEAKKKAQEEMRKRAQEEEKKFQEAEKRIREAEKKAREVKMTRAQEAEIKARKVEMTRVQEAERKFREAEIKRAQEEKKKVEEVEIKTKKEMKTMEEEKKPMEDEKKAKEVKVKAKKEDGKLMEEQKTTMEPFLPPKNNNGRSALFISLIALAVAFFNFFTPPASAPTQNVDLGGIEDNINAVSSNVKKMNSKITENRRLLDSQIASSAEQFEQQKSETDKMYLTSGFTELVKGMKPSLEIYCKRATVSYIKLAKTAKTGTNTVAVDCNFNNRGRLKASIVPGSLIMIGGKAQQVIDNAVERIDNGEATSILPGKNNEKQYHIVLTETGAANMKGGVLKMSFQAYTDEAALGMIKRKTNKEITGEQLKELTEKKHLFSFLL